LLNRLKTVAAEVDVEWNEDEYLKSQNLIFVQLKALMARDLYDSSAFFRIINDENDIYLDLV
jgi:carboxyl-terminal processing protease